MDNIIGKQIKIHNDILELVECEYNMKFKYYIIVKQYDDICDLLVGFFTDYESMEYYYPQLMFYGFDSKSDMYCYDFKTFFVNKNQCNYKEIIRLSKIKKLLNETK